MNNLRLIYLWLSLVEKFLLSLLHLLFVLSMQDLYFNLIGMNVFLIHILLFTKLLKFLKSYKNIEIEWLPIYTKLNWSLQFQFHLLFLVYLYFLILILKLVHLQLYIFHVDQIVKSNRTLHPDRTSFDFQTSRVYHDFQDHLFLQSVPFLNQQLSILSQLRLFVHPPILQLLFSYFCFRSCQVFQNL